MDTLGQAMGSEEGTVARRRMRTIAEKRRIVEETLERGASVPVVARKYAVNANLLFGWRRLYKQGLLEGCREPAAQLLPVEVTTPSVVATRSAAPEGSKSQRRAVPVDAHGNHLEIEWPTGVRLRLQGSVETHVLKTVLAALMRR
jgi:transposase